MKIVKKRLKEGNKPRLVYSKAVNYGILCFMNSLTVLLVEDDIEVLDVLNEYLLSLGHQVESYPNPLEALKGLENNPHRFSVALVDHHMPGMTGYDFVIKIRGMGLKVPVVLSSGNHTLDFKLDGVESIMFVDKPYDLGELNKLLYGAAGSIKPTITAH